MADRTPGTIHPFHTMSAEELQAAIKYWDAECKRVDAAIADLFKLSRQFAKVRNSMRWQGRFPREMRDAAAVWLAQREAEAAAEKKAEQDAWLAQQGEVE